ncbi:MAG: hypothetical protein P1S60_07110 [Anaerolineae bacterium]|nr:hypothetical protein [Anaerolineae bacterium]
MFEVHDCAPDIPPEPDTTYTRDSLTTWVFPAYSDTTVPAEITYEGNDVGENAGDNLDEGTSEGKNAGTTIKYEDGEILEITYSYDTELFSVRREPAPRPITTHFVTREITKYVSEPRSKWDNPKLMFGAGCVTGATIILITGYALGAIL